MILSIDQVNELCNIIAAEEMDIRMNQEIDIFLDEECMNILARLYGGGEDFDSFAF
jgi:hypothetical protein